MVLNIVIPRLNDLDFPEFKKCKAAALNQWSSDLNIELIEEDGCSYPEIFNKAIGKLSSGSVLFLLPHTVLKDQIFERIKLSHLISDTTDTVVLGYEKIEFGTSSHAEFSKNVKSVNEFLLAFHEHPGDIAYTSLWNKILSVDIIKKYNLKFDSAYKESFEYAFLLEYIQHSAGIVILDQLIVTYFSKAKPKLAANERIEEKIRLFDLYQSLLTKRFDRAFVTRIMDKERLEYILYEKYKANYKTSIERQCSIKLLRRIYNDVENKSFLVVIFFYFKYLKVYIGRIKYNWINKSIFFDREKIEEKTKKRESFWQKNYHYIRYPARLLHRCFNTDKYILLYCDNQTMKPHIIDYYNCVKKMPQVRFFIYYPGGWSNEVPENVTLIKTSFEALNIPWDMIVLADAHVPLYYKKNEAELLYINHGLHMISYDDGETLYAYDAGKGQFSAFLEPNKSYAEILSKEYPEEHIVHVGYKNSEAIIKQTINRNIIRDKLGFTDRDIVVAVFGTWGAESLFHKVGNSLITQAKEMMKSNYKFILSIHPKEYTKYDEALEPLGGYVESLATDGFIIRNPKYSSIEYMIAADIVICDYTTLCEEAFLAGKPVLLSSFSDNQVWKNSIIANYKKKAPFFSKDDDLRASIERIIDDYELKDYANSLVRDLLPPVGGYKKAVYEITKKLLHGGRKGNEKV